MHGSPPYHLTDIVMDLTVKMHIPDLFMRTILYYSADLFHINTCLYFFKDISLFGTYFLS